MGASQAVRNPGSYLARTGRMYRTLFTDPGAFYDEYVGSRGILSEVLVVAVIGLVGTLGNYLAFTAVTEAAVAAGLAVNQDVELQLYRSVIAPLAGAFVLWIALAAALYGVSWLYSTVGGFYVTLKRSAWALVPMLFANLLHTIAMAYVSLDLEFPDDAQYPSRIPDQQAAYIWSQAGEEMLVVAATAVSVVFVAWVGYIAAHAIADVRDLELGEAYRVAAVPAALYALYVLYQVVGSI